MSMKFQVQFIQLNQIQVVIGDHTSRLILVYILEVFVVQKLYENFK